MLVNKKTMLIMILISLIGLAVAQVAINTDATLSYTTKEKETITQAGYTNVSIGELKCSTEKKSCYAYMYQRGEIKAMFALSFNISGDETDQELKELRDIKAKRKLLQKAEEKIKMDQERQRTYDSKISGGKVTIQ